MNKHLPFPDSLVIGNNNKLEIYIYRKATNTNRSITNELKVLRFKKRIIGYQHKTNKSF